MSSRWIRLDVNWEDTEWLADLTGCEAGCWPRLLCIAKQSGIRGTVSIPSIRVLANRWRVDVEDIENMRDAAISAGAIEVDGKVWTICSWDEYQPDMTNRKRQQKHRDRDDEETV